MKKSLSIGMILLFIGVLFWSSSEVQDKRDENGSLPENSNSISQEDIYKTAVSIYEIPSTVLKRMPVDLVSRFTMDIEMPDRVSSNDTYWEISSGKDGKGIAREASYDEYLTAVESDHGHKTAWMKIHMTVIDKGDCARAAVLCTWLTKPVIHLKNIVGLSIIRGTIIDNSADGFYSYATKDGMVYNVDFKENPSEFNYSGMNVIRSIDTGKPEKALRDEIIFMKVDIYKESTWETFTGSYVYQGAHVSRDDLFTSDESGGISVVDGNLDFDHHQCRGSIFVEW